MDRIALPADRYQALEQAIYEAAVIPEKWPEVLDSLREIGGGRGAALLSVSDRGSRWAASPDFTDIMSEFVETIDAARNSRIAAGLANGLHMQPRFVTESDCFESGQLPDDAMHSDFLGRFGLGPFAGTIAALPHGDMLFFSVERTLVDGTIDDQSLGQLDSLRPHLARAAMLTARLGLERVRTAVDTLSQLGFAAAAVEENGKVLVANGGFEIDSIPWTTRQGDRIALLDRSADALLQQSLEQIATVAGVRSIPLRDDGLFVRHVLHVVPVRRLAHDLFTRAHAILVITSSAEKAGSPSLLQALFDLTPAEAALARRLGTGDSLDVVARDEHRSLATLRNQLRSILAKTGCTRQAELTRMLARLVPPGL